MARSIARLRATVWGELLAEFTSPAGRSGGAADSTPTFSIFATFPAPYFGSSMIGPFIDQIVGTAFLLMFVLALTDERNQPPKSNLAPLLVGTCER